MIILFATCWGMYWYLTSDRNTLHLLRQISFDLVVFLMVLRILYMGTYGLFLKISMAKFHVHLSIMEWFGLPFITTMGNQLTPFAGGVLIRALYLKRRHSLPYAAFTTILAANHLVVLWMVGVTGLLTCVLFRDLGSWRWPLTGFFSILVGIITVIFVLPNFSLPGQGIFIRTFNRIMEGWALIKEDKHLLVFAVIIVFAGIVLNGLSFWLAYHSLDLTVRPQAVVLLSLLPFFLIFISITPGNIGVQEIVIGLLSMLLGGGAGKGLVVALMIRATTMIPAVILGIFSGFFLARNLNYPQSVSPSAGIGSRVSSLFRELSGKNRYE
jgi:uncharacterized membrane protein YbhN (UPF0104 family)